MKMLQKRIKLPERKSKFVEFSSYPAFSPSGGSRFIQANKNLRIRQISDEAARMTQQGLWFGFENTPDKGQFWFKRFPICVPTKDKKIFGKNWLIYLREIRCLIDHSLRSGGIKSMWQASALLAFPFSAQFKTIVLPRKLPQASLPWHFMFRAVLVSGDLVCHSCGVFRPHNVLYSLRHRWSAQKRNVNPKIFSLQNPNGDARKAGKLPLSDFTLKAFMAAWLHAMHGWKSRRKGSVHVREIPRGI